MVSFEDISKEVLEFKHEYEVKNEKWVHVINKGVGFDLIDPDEKIKNMFVGPEKTYITVLTGYNTVQKYIIDHKTSNVEIEF